MKKVRIPLTLILPACASIAFADGIVSGFHNYGGYAQPNTLFQWKMGRTAGSSRYLGAVKLDDSAHFGYNIKLADMAALSDSTVVITHRDIADSKWQISVLKPLCDETGSLTNATIVMTMDQPSTHQASQVAPLPGAGFVTARTSAGVIYTQTSSNTWSTFTMAMLETHDLFDVAGLIPRHDQQFVTGDYDRGASKYNAGGRLAKYNHTGGLWGYNARPGEGIRCSLLASAWVVMGEQGVSQPSYVEDDAHTDGGTYDPVVGKITEADGSEIYGRAWAGLRDGRVACIWTSGWMQDGPTFRVYTLVKGPAHQSADSVGAAGHDFEVTFHGTPNSVGPICGDYMILPPNRGTVVLFR